MAFEFFKNDSENALSPPLAPKMLAISFNCLLILGLSLIILWPRKEPFLFIRGNEIPLSFLVIFVAALLMSSYVNLRSGRGEIFRDTLSSRVVRNETVTLEEMCDFFPLGLVEFLLHTLLFLFIFFPLLVVSVAISEISLKGFFMALSILFTSSLLCRMFAFLTILLWGKGSSIGYLLSRLFFLIFFFFTGTFAPYTNPVLLIYNLHKGDRFLALYSMDTYLFFIILVTSIILLMILANHALIRRNTRRRRGRGE